MDWVTIDFEASCLPQHGRSYPIEVGISGPLGTSSWLIRPLPEWREWDWTDEAFALHGISRERLDDEGLEPRIVVAEVRKAIGAARVIADSTIDTYWWQLLLGAAEPGIATAAPLRIEHVGVLFDELGAIPEQILFAQRRADRLSPERHRAGADSRWLFTLLATLSQQIAADREEAAQTWPTDGTHDVPEPAVKARV
jgi:hypothetical protein